MMKLSSSRSICLVLVLAPCLVGGFVVPRVPTSNNKKTTLNVATSPPPKKIGGFGGFGDFGPFGDFGGSGKMSDFSKNRKKKSMDMKNKNKSVESPNAKSIINRQFMENVVVDPDYYFTWTLALLGPLIMWYHPSYTLDGTPSMIGLFGGCFHMLFATLLGVQTARVRLVFGKDGFEFYNIKGKGLDLNKGAKLVPKPSNYVAGTDNKWKYDKITHYGFFPSIDYPVICYFKETQTPKHKWNRWFAAFDSNSGKGQPHFFPGICNVKKVKEQFELRGVKRKPVTTFAKLGKQKNDQ